MITPISLIYIERPWQLESAGFTLAQSVSRFIHHVAGILEVFASGSFLWITVFAVVILLVAWRSEVKRTNDLRSFAVSRGYRFNEGIDPKALNLNSTSFFKKRDRIKNVITGILSSQNFVYFEQHAKFSRNFR